MGFYWRCVGSTVRSYERVLREQVVLFPGESKKKKKLPGEKPSWCLNLSSKVSSKSIFSFLFRYYQNYVSVFSVAAEIWLNKTIQLGNFMSDHDLAFEI